MGLRFWQEEVGEFAKISRITGRVEGFVPAPLLPASLSESRRKSGDKSLFPTCDLPKIEHGNWMLASLKMPKLQPRGSALDIPSAECGVRSAEYQQHRIRTLPEFCSSQSYKQTATSRRLRRLLTPGKQDKNAFREAKRATTIRLITEVPLS